MISRRQLLIGSAVVPVLSYLDLTQAFADTPKDILVVAQQVATLTRRSRAASMTDSQIETTLPVGEPTSCVISHNVAFLFLQRSFH